MLRIVVVGLLILVAAMMVMRRQERGLPQPETAVMLPEARSLPATAFTDAQGEPFTTADLAGQYTLLFFGYTNCPDICPLTLQELAIAKSAIASRAPAAVPNVVFASVDPARDSTETVRNYLAHFDTDFIGLTTSEDALAPLISMLGVSVHRIELDDGHYNVVHNGSIYVLDPDAQWIALFGGSDHDPAKIEQDYFRIRRLRAAGVVGTTSLRTAAQE